MSNRVSVMGGLLTLFQNKIKDEEVVRACSEMLFKFAEAHSGASPRNDPRSDPRSLLSAVPQALKSTPTGASTAAAIESTNPPVIEGKMSLPVSEYRNSEGQIWECEAVSLAVQALEHMCVGSCGRRPSTGKRDSESRGSKDKDRYREVDMEKEKERDRDRDREKDDRKDKEDKDKSPRSSRAAPASVVKGVSSWSKHTPKSILSVVALMEIISTLTKIASETGLIERVRLVLQSVLVVLPPKHSETTRRIEKFLAKLLISHPIPVSVVIPVPVPVSARGTGTGTGEDSGPTLFPVLSSRGAHSSKPSSRETSERVKEVKETADPPAANMKAYSAGNTRTIIQIDCENHGFTHDTY